MDTEYSVPVQVQYEYGTDVLTYANGRMTKHMEKVFILGLNIVKNL